jgi:hypothetical protein
MGSKIIIKQGAKFGKLTVLRDLGNHNPRHESRFECQCDCGKVKSMIGYHLRSGASKSCGCTNRRGKTNSKWLGCEELGGTEWSCIRYCAKKRGIPFKITIKDGWKLFIRQDKLCALTNVPISLRKYGEDTTSNASLDRIDSSKGYTKDNCQWVLKNINLMKQDLDEKEFISLCKLVARYNND